MPTPEYPNASDLSEDDTHTTRFTFLQRQIEVVDENENSMERTFRREALLEELDELSAESS